MYKEEFPLKEQQLKDVCGKYFLLENRTRSFRDNSILVKIIKPDEFYSNNIIIEHMYQVKLLAVTNSKYEYIYHFSDIQEIAVNMLSGELRYGGPYNIHMYRLCTELSEYDAKQHTVMMRL